MENHNFTQAFPTYTPQQIFTNAAAPFINSLITAGHSNAVQVSYATRYFSAGAGVRPSEPNYVWAEAGTDFGSHTDDDPGSSSGNIFTAPHLTAQLSAAGIPWKTYQEDLEYSPSPLLSAAGSTSIKNFFNGSTGFSYVARHNPMVFFQDTQIQNIYPLTNLFSDLMNNHVGRYNWITPNLVNDMHDALGGGFTYHGTTYYGDAAAIAQGDSFLSQIVPRIMNSDAYRSTGLIILWWDETEFGDSTNYTLPEIILSPLAKGNAYASVVELNHSSDIKTMEEIFGLSFLTNAIPSNELNATGSGYNQVASVNDLSDMLVPASVIPCNFAGRLVAGTGFELTFSLAAGQPYRILTSGDVTTPLSNWPTLASGTALSSLVKVKDTNVLAQRFYRVASP
ncbi:MAG TPA: alkaline phosphatase family protein [Candidatus Dormibacteraeota bacterium]|nr:alkaline phosphatase family protein [Candidatus Dormibacteraeota bacterium]